MPHAVWNRGVESSMRYETMATNVFNKRRSDKMQEAVDKFLAETNDSFRNLIEQSDTANQSELLTKFREALLVFLLENDIINAHTYCGDTNENNQQKQGKSENVLMERANLMIKKLVIRLLEKDQQIEYLRRKLQTML
ncbi:hypothetical protein Tcan_18422 [Toxocara canis]|uniref:Uncharacterized protein n=2 Tax=Toxocara canis TaxID=6265 RepID=A0A0B2VSB5_TOXCA|nr:hypothetical protein Tcan_18422 [Toxocara canis]